MFGPTLGSSSVWDRAAILVKNVEWDFHLFVYLEDQVLICVGFHLGSTQFGWDRIGISMGTVQAEFRIVQDDVGIPIDQCTG